MRRLRLGDGYRPGGGRVVPSPQSVPGECDQRLELVLDRSRDRNAARPAWHGSSPRWRLAMPSACRAVAVRRLVAGGMHQQARSPSR